MANSAWVNGKFTLAENYALRSYELAQSNEFLDLQILSRLTQAKIDLENADNIEAINKLSAAKFLLKKNKESVSKEIGYKIDQAEFEFYERLNDFEEAEIVKIRLREKFAIDPDVEIYKILNNELELYRINIDHGNSDFVKKPLYDLIKTASEKHVGRVRSEAMSLYRRLLIDSGDFEGMKQFFVEEFPGELERLKEADGVLFCTVQGYMCEADNMVDSAKYYFELAEEQALETDNKWYISHFYYRYGLFHFRNNQQDDAYKQFQKSYKISKEVGADPVTLSSSRYLDTLSRLQNDYRSAYEFISTINRIEAKLAEKAKKDDIEKVKYENALKEAAYEEELYKEEKKKKAERQYFIITVVITLLFILMMIISSMAVSAWVIEMLSFINTLLLFEFIVLMLDFRIHHYEVWQVYLIKIALLSFIFPLHHFAEEKISQYLKRRSLIRPPSRNSIRNFLAKLWPWAFGNGDHHH